jgi:hypothetical protein
MDVVVGVVAVLVVGDVAVGLVTGLLGLLRGVRTARPVAVTISIDVERIL